MLDLAIVDSTAFKMLDILHDNKLELLKGLPRPCVEFQERLESFPATKKQFGINRTAIWATTLTASMSHGKAPRGRTDRRIYKRGQQLKKASDFVQGKRLWQGQGG
jgi:hypothetical protein